MKKVTKKLQKFIDSISTVGGSNIPDDDGEIYYSKIDGSYITRVGLENDIAHLLKLGITEQVQSCIGFNPIEQKWFGWSHRAIFGFGIGSECKIGSCAYEPDSKEAFAEDCLRFWGDTDLDEDNYKDKPTVREETKDGELGSYVEYTYNHRTPNKALRGQLSGMFSRYPKKFGKGEWTAKTLEDAKIMAIDFANGVS